MIKNSKFLSLIFISSLTLTALTGCTNEQEVKEQPMFVEDSSIKIENEELLIEQVGYLHGFPSDNLVEFKLTHEDSEILRVFEVGKDISSFLSNEKQDGTLKLTLTYQESSDGISNPILIKVSK